jgi:hypothetical protein
MKHTALLDCWRKWFPHWFTPKKTKDWLPPEWPRDLPSHEAAFVFTMRLRPREAEYRCLERRYLAYTAKVCKRAIKYIAALQTSFLAFPIPENHGGSRRLYELLSSLEDMANYCEEAAQGKRGRPREMAQRILIRQEYRDFQREHPGRKGYWRDSVSNEYKGRFLDQLEETLNRLGYPAKHAKPSALLLNGHSPPYKSFKKPPIYYPVEPPVICCFTIREATKVWG